MAAHPKALLRWEHTRRCVRSSSIPLLLACSTLACSTLACSTEDDLGTARSARSDDVAPSDTKPADAGETPRLSGPPVETPISDASTSLEASSPEAAGGSPEDDSGSSAAPPLLGCPSELPEDPDSPHTSCEEGYYACAQGHAYLCIWDDSVDDECWRYAPDVTCPLWSEDRCEAAFDELSAAQPCSADTDCTIWGGVSASTACNIPSGTPALSVSRLLSSAERDALRAAYDDALSHGCVEDWGYDSAPHEAFCAAGQCRSWQRSCFDDFDADASASAQ